MNQLRAEGLGYALDSTEHYVRFTIDNVRPIGAYIGGWVVVESIADDEPAFLVQGTYRMDAPDDENKLVRELFSLTPETRAMGQYVWKEMVHTFFASVVHKEKDGVPFTKVGRLDSLTDDTYVVEDLIQRGDPTIFFGGPKATKGTIAAALCVSVLLGHDFAGLKVASGVPMYLDWEDSALRLNQRVQSIARGIGVPKADFPEVEYLRCTRPLADMVSKIAKQRDRVKADFCVVDSLDPASGYDGSWNERAGRLFEAVRVLDMTTLIIAHSNKISMVGKGEQKQDMSVFGSVMNTARARAIWRVQKEQDAESSEAMVTLIQEQVNHDRIKKPIALQVSWRHMGETRIQQHWPDMKQLAI